MKKTIQSGGAKIFYTKKGNGPAVMFLHGFGEDSSIWKNIEQNFSDYLLIIPDLPGSGESALLDQEKVTLSDFADCMADILAIEKIDCVHFIGHSMGGYIAMEFASRYPDKLNSICLFHSGAHADDPEKIETRRKGIKFIKTNGVSAFLKTSIPGLFKDAEKQKETIDRLIDDAGKFSSRSLIQYYEAMIARKDHSLLLSSLKIPVQFIIGEHDKAIPFEISLKQCYRPPISFVHILRSSAHMGMYEEPDKITPMLLDFLKEVTKG